MVHKDLAYYISQKLIMTVLQIETFIVVLGIVSSEIRQHDWKTKWLANVMQNRSRVECNKNLISISWYARNTNILSYINKALKWINAAKNEILSLKARKDL
jgi:hypothetical protein